MKHTGYLVVLFAAAYPIACSADKGVERQEVADLRMQGTVATLRVDSPRPVATAVMLVANDLGYRVTYEDPKYEYAGDLQDVTSMVRGDANPQPGEVTKIIVPSGGALNVRADTKSPKELLGQLVQAQASAGKGGQFRVLEEDGFLHVVPTASRSRNGAWQNRTSILDVAISLPTRKRSAFDLMDAITRAIGSKVGVPVNYGGILGGGAETFEFGAREERARAVLSRAVSIFCPAERPCGWVLMRSGDKLTDAYALSLIPVKPPEQEFEPPAAPKVRETSPFDVPVTR